MFKNLGAEENDVFYNDEGNTTTSKESKYPHKGKEYFLPISRVSKENQQRLEDFNISLTDNGRKALDIIVETTARQIKNKN